MDEIEVTDGDETDPKAFVRLRGPFGEVVDGLRKSEGRPLAQMAARLMKEALATRGLWDLLKDEPKVPEAPPPRPKSGLERPAYPAKKTAAGSR